MRNWNWNSWEWNTHHMNDFILPMRNWNIENARGYDAKDEFYLTYEELKLCQEAGQPRHIVLILSYLWGIETTISSNLNFIQSTDFILPMRNWNIYSWDYGIELQEILSYLWGIETWFTSNTSNTGSYRFYLTYEELKPYFQWQLE